MEPLTVDDALFWFRDPYAFDQAKQAADAILEACRPPGSPEPPAYEEAEFVAGMRRFGPEYARKLLTEISLDAPGDLAKELRRDLDPDLLKQLETAGAGK